MKVIQFLESLARQGLTVDQVWGELSKGERAALTYDWCGFWARPDQEIPSGEWRSCGRLAGRGNGKTVANVGWIMREIVAGRCGAINLIGPTEDDAWAVGVEDPFGGLLAWTPPWFKPEVTKVKLVWPNGATCRVYGAHRPGKIRGGGLDIVWCTELQTWPASTAIAAWDNAVIKTREGQCRVLWDATSERANELIGDRVRESIAYPHKYILVRGRTRDNTLLGERYIFDIYDRYTERDDNGIPLKNPDGSPKLTRRGREELDAEYSLDSAGALWKTADIQHHEPRGIERCVVSIDPAFSAERGSDQTGICVAGLDSQGCVVVLEDKTGKWQWEEWGDLALKLYHDYNADCLIVERNKGGDAVAANIRARVLVHGGDVRVEVLERGKRGAPRHDPSVVRVREVTALDPKWNRAEPVASLYPSGAAYHARVFRRLETTMTTWEPGPGVRSPNDLDALTQAVHELRELGGGKARVDVAGIAAIQREAASMAQGFQTIRGLVPSRGRSRI